MQSLTPRERQVLLLLATGTQNREIGRRISRSRSRVEVIIKGIYSKLGAVDRPNAVAMAMAKGIFTKLELFVILGSRQPLRRTQKRIFDLAVAGKNEAEIAEALGYSWDTVQQYISRAVKDLKAA